MKYDYENIIFETSLEKNEITALLNHINKNDCQLKARLLVSKFNNHLSKIGGMKLRPEHLNYANKYIIKQHINPKTNRVRLKGPFNTLELIQIVFNIKEIKLKELYFAGTPFKDFYTPLYEVFSTDNESFKYFVFNNEIQIYNI